MKSVVIGLGANLGDRHMTLRTAVAQIGARDTVTLRAVSRVYETTPIGTTDQPSFLNAAILVACGLPPLALLDELLAIERGLGRERPDAVRWGPRTIDLDILWIEGLVVNEERLVVPHPRLTERAFALLPLLEVAPEAIDPRTGDRYVAPADQGVEATALALGL